MLKGEVFFEKNRVVKPPSILSKLFDRVVMLRELSWFSFVNKSNAVTGVTDLYMSSVSNKSLNSAFVNPASDLLKKKIKFNMVEKVNKK